MIALVLLGGVAALGAAVLRLFMVVGAGYKAKVLCTGTFVSGRTMDPASDEQVSAESYWFLRSVTAAIDVERRTVTASVLGLVTRHAVYRPDLGATLIAPGESPAGLVTLNPESNTAAGTPAQQPTPSAAHRAEAASTSAPSRFEPLRHGGTTDSQSRDLLQIVDAAFLDPPRGRRRRTQAVLIVRDGDIIAERYASGFSADTPLPGWSMAKSVLSALVGLLVQDGRLALDQRELLPQWRAPDPRAEICLEDLLRMRSGLRFSEAYALPWSDVLHMLYRSSDLGNYSAGRPLAHKPGTVWQYASGTSNILSLICRRTLGDASYASWPRRALFERLGMSSALFEPDAAGTFVCSSYMVATARDWARYGLMWMNGGRVGQTPVLDDSWIAFSTSSTPQSPQGRYGAHWWLGLNPEVGGETAAAARIPRDAFFAVGHEAQTLTVIPSKRLVVVRLGGAIHIDTWNQAQFIADICGVV